MFSEKELGNLLVKRFDTFLNSNEEFGGDENITKECIIG